MADVFSDEVFAKPLKQGELVLHSSASDKRRFLFVLKPMSVSWYDGVVPLLEGQVFGRFKLSENTEVADWTEEQHGLALHAGDESSSIYLSSDEKDDVDAWKTEVLLAVEELKIKALSLNAELIMEGWLTVLQFDFAKGEWDNEKLYFMLQNAELRYYNAYPSTLPARQCPRGTISLGVSSTVAKIQREDTDFTLKLVVDAKNTIILAAEGSKEETNWIRNLRASILRLATAEASVDASKKHRERQLSEVSEETEINKVYVIPEKDTTRFGEIIRDTTERKRFVEKKLGSTPAAKRALPPQVKPNKAKKVWRRLFLWGSSAQGELCSPVLSHSNEPELVKGFKKRLQAKDLQLGESFGAILTQEDSQVFVWGRSPLGLGEVRLNSPQLVRALHDVKVSKISCGANHMAAISDSFQLFTWGRGVKGELGQGVKKVCVPEPEPLKMDFPVTSVDCGLEHTLILVDKESSHSQSALFVCGGHSFGKLGLPGHVENLFIPVEVAKLCHENIIHISAGRTFSLVASKNTCFHWGKVGHHRNILPARLEAFESEIVQVAAGNNFGMILCKEAAGTTVYSYGGAGYLLSNGVGKVSKHVHPIDALSKHEIIQISCGKKHAAALASDGTLFCWGSNSAGQLGNGYTPSLGQPYESIMVLSYKYTHLSCGGNTTGALAEYKENHEESELWELKRPPEPPESYHVQVNNPPTNKLPKRLITTLRKLRT